MHTFFVSGIDTGIGKTYVTGLLLRYLRAVNRPAISLKFVQTGNDAFSEDIELHRKIAGTGLLPEDLDHTTAPQIFRFPSSPKLAAERENRSIDLPAILSSAKKLSASGRIVLVEGAGGLMVPLDEERYIIDVVRQAGWKLLLVTSGRLGSLNHTLLSLEAVFSREIPVSAILYVKDPSADPLIDRDSPREILRFCASRGHAKIPVLPVPWVSLDALPSLPEMPDFSPAFPSDR
ncbi:MAG: dethiobiotin synthase [Kiritimatiellia bacterium]